jgi:hypothetical protein
MERSYLVLWFALALFVVLGSWGVYNLMTAEPPPPPTTAPSTQSLVDRLRAERERRMNEGKPAATTTAPSVE